MDAMNEAAPPPITQELRAEARRHPGGWVYAIDPEIDPAGEVPPAAIEGAWAVSDQGDIVGEFIRNDRYRPSPTALGWPNARSALERAIQLSRSGLVGPEYIERAFVDAEIFLLVDARGAPLIGVLQDGQRCASAFTSRDYAGDQRTAALTGRELMATVPVGVRVDLDPGRESAWSLGG